jgi:ABC-2 type transport system permease protein
MENWLRLYGAQIVASMKVEFEYRVAVMIWLVSLFVEPLVYIGVWSAIARMQGGTVGGYTPQQFAAYYLAYLFVRQAAAAQNPVNFAWRIQHGTMSGMLLRPVHPLHMDIGENLGGKILSTTLVIPPLVILALLYQADFHPPLWALAAFVPALIMAWMIRFIIQWAISSVAFFTTRVHAIWQTYVVAHNFLGGAIAPIQLLPLPLQALAAVMPFRWIFHFPLELLIGRLDVQQTLEGFAAQIVWIMGSFVVMLLIWNAGVKRFSAVGG